MKTCMMKPPPKSPKIKQLFSSKCLVVGWIHNTHVLFIYVGISHVVYIDPINYDLT